MSVDSTFEFERRRNCPLRYSRPALVAAVAAIRRISALKAHRNLRVYKTRLLASRNKTQTLAEAQIEKNAQVIVGRQTLKQLQDEQMLQRKTEKGENLTLEQQLQQEQDSKHEPLQHKYNNNKKQALDATALERRRTMRVGLLETVKSRAAAKQKLRASLSLEGKEVVAKKQEERRLINAKNQPILQSNQMEVEP
eukprot:GHVT01095046.1.p1 GENE.GHVT01095046.1~~GHVT01095046.1.p1  ORF type:complete len:195 (+),score=39.49 GHVT01095046.1:425-1009(+)